MNAARNPRDRLVLALAAIHAARPKAIRELQLDDINLGDRRLTIAGRTRPLDDLTRQMILDWLGHRRNRWPDTSNPYRDASSSDEGSNGYGSDLRLGGNCLQEVDYFRYVLPSSSRT